jgi:hypothetical protein
MRLIQNTNVAFRCPDSLKEKLEAYAAENDVHTSVIIRAACSTYLKEQAPHLFWSPPNLTSASTSKPNGWLTNSSRS